MSGLKRHDRVSKNGKAYHWYTWNGEKLPSVTSVLSAALPKPALTYWASRTVAEFVADNPIEVEALRAVPRDRMVADLKDVPWRERDAAANRGTEVHKLAERLVKGEAVEVPGALSGYVDSYVKFLDEWQPKPVLVEATVANLRWKYAGQLDLVADLPNGERAVMDLKTSKGVYPETSLQCAAYRHAEIYLDDNDTEKRLSDLAINAAYVVHVRADGYDVRRLDVSEDGPFKVFLHLLWLSTRIGDAMKPWLGAPAAAPTIKEAL
jgi:hypothetical protein